MKKLIALSFTAFLLTSCYIDSIESRYDSRDRITGSYEVEEYSETYDDYTYYSFRVSKSSYRDEVYFNNFYGADIRIYAVVSNDRITIPFQEENGYEIEGVGTIRGSEIHLSYTVKDLYDHSYTDYCETVAWME
jgi:hypothetical protein